MNPTLLRFEGEKENKMKKEKKETKKAEYKKPILTKHKNLKDVTALLSTTDLGCTRNF